jgi:hypothetical protein
MSSTLWSVFLAQQGVWPHSQMVVETGATSSILRASIPLPSRRGEGGKLFQRPPLPYPRNETVLEAESPQR